LQLWPYMQTARLGGFPAGGFRAFLLATRKPPGRSPATSRTTGWRYACPLLHEWHMS
jgi:hypothetical protein